MALKNFIKEGSYLTFERIDYSKILKILNANIIVFKDDTKQEVILRTSISIAGINGCIDIKKAITTEDELMEMAPEYLDLKEEEAIYIDIENPESEYAQQANKKTIIRQENGNILLHSPIYIYNPETKKTYERQIDDSFKELDDYDIKTGRQFDVVIDSSNIIGSLYEILKRQIIYKDCIDA